MSIVIGNILSELDRIGYTYIKNVDVQKVDYIIKQIGEVIGFFEVKEYKNKHELIFSNKKMPFHCDHPSANFILWHCIENSNIGGESIIVDAHECIKEFSKNEIEILKKISLNIDKKYKSLDKFEANILIEEQNSFHFFFQPWGYQKLSTKQKDVLIKLYSLIENSEIIKIPMFKNDILIINNKRMLHSRNAFELNSKRCLNRYWIKKKSYE